MKTSIYIDDGHSQIVLTPETPWERTLLKQMAEENMSASIKQCSFHRNAFGYFLQDTEQSIIIRVEKETSV